MAKTRKKAEVQEQLQASLNSPENSPEQPTLAPSKLSTSKKNSRENKLFQNLLKIVTQYIQGKRFVPQKESELFERLKLPAQHTDIFHEIMQTLLEQGIVARKAGLFTVNVQKKVSDDMALGILRVHPRGFGFLQPEDSQRFPQDIFIPKHLTQNAVDGDTVEVKVNLEVVSEKGPEGKVITILARGRTHIAGIVRAVEKHGDIVVYVPLLGPSQRVIVESSPKQVLQEGDRIVMKVREWGAKDTETVCELSNYLGHISDPSCDIKAAIAEYELRAEFPAKVVSEAESYGSRVSTKEIALREDLRQTECFTIDPDTAKDFDDAISVSKDAHGHYHLGVHIADVSYYVKPGTALDKEAKMRCNSTYFPRFCLPMLPSVLSDNLCSLKANVNRLTASVIMEFDASGSLVHYRVARTVIKSAKRFSYREAKEVLDGKKKSSHLPTLNLMVELCGLLKQKRYERGSIEFSIPELVVMVDENGVPQGTDYISYDITHQLVEEFMLKANETVAWHLSKMGKNLTYRIHEEPAEENMRDFSLLATAFGFRLSDNPTPKEMQQLFDEAANTTYGPYLATSYIRRMRLAFYSPDNVGHYGLGLTHYCHFTSPIRRYVDLVAHRILFGEDDDREELEMISAQCSTQERISAKAESSVVILKKLRLLNSIHEKEPFKEYQAVVTRVKNFGFSFEVIDLMLEGFLHVSELHNDYYVYDETRMTLRGRHHGETYRSGDRVSVLLRSVDFILLESKWGFAGAKEERPEGKGKFARREKSHKHSKKTKAHKAKKEPAASSQTVHEETAKNLPHSHEKPLKAKRERTKSSSHKKATPAKEIIAAQEKAIPTSNRKPFAPVRALKPTPAKAAAKKTTKPTDPSKSKRAAPKKTVK